MMSGGLLVFLSLFAGVAALTCPAADHPRFQCSVSAMFIIDASYHTGTVQNINTMFDFLESRILPRYGFLEYQSALLALIGGSKEGYQSTTNYNMACHEAETLRQDAIYNGLQNVSLADSLQHIFKDFGAGFDQPIILFTANNDKDDINRAGDFVRNQYSNTQFTIVSFNVTMKTWSNFHFYGFYDTTYDKLFDERGLDNCILAYSCRAVEDYCSITYMPSNTTHATYTVPTTYSNPITSPFMCSCYVEQVWNDVIILMDVSYGEGVSTVSATWNYIKKAFTRFNIDRDASSAGTEFYMKLGVVTYGDNAAVANTFGTLNSSDFQALKTPSMSGSGAAVEKAIVVAMQQFTSRARPNAKKTILILGSDFTGNEADLVAARDKFYQMGGNFVIFDNRGSLNPVLYTLTDSIVPYDDDGKLLRTAMCHANCFCPKNTVGYFKENGVQAGGCYLPTVASSRILANRFCNQANGYLAMDQNGSKTQFIQSQFPQNAASWIGLAYNLSQDRYLWSDNSTLSTNYAPWASPFVMPPPSDKGCVILSNGTWVQSDCRQGWPGICEVAPCDSLHMCS